MKSIAKICILSAISILITSSLCDAQERRLIVAGFLSSNIIEFDLDTGFSSELISLPGLQPRGVTTNSDGEIFAGLRYGSQNVVRIVEDGNGGYEAVDFTDNLFGRFGPGHMQFHSSGNLFVGGDDSAELFEIDGQTGALVNRFAIADTGTTLGIVIHDDYLYSAEYFDEQIQRYDLSSTPYSGSHIVTSGENLSRPLGLAFDPAGILTVANDSAPELTQFDADGNYLGTLFSMDDVGRNNSRGIIFDELTDSYFVASGSSVYQIGSNGVLLNTYSSGLLDDAYGLSIITSVPEPSSGAALLFSVTAISCLVLRRYRRK